MKGTEHFVSLQTSAVLAEKYVMVNSEESVATLETKCPVNRGRYNQPGSAVYCTHYCHEHCREKNLVLG
jgi:hypothetical protein